MNAIVQMNTTAPMRARDYSPTQLALVRRTVAKDCNEDEFDLFVEVCRRVGLDPFRRQIYAVVYSKDNADKRQMSIITGIDGFRAVAARNRDYRPDDEEPQFTYDQSIVGPENPLGIVKCVTKAFKLGPDGQWHAVVGTAYWVEFVPIKEDAEGGYDWIDTGEKWPDTGKPKKRKVARGETKRIPSGQWGTMPHVMISKCSEAQALRRGWPEDLSGVYVREEMDRAEIMDLTASEVVEQQAQGNRLALVNAHDKVAIQWSPASPIEFVPNGSLFDRSCKWLREQSDPSTIEQWREINRNGLAEFWALHKADALELKREIEARIAALKKPEPVTIDQPPAEPEPVAVAKPAAAAPELTLTPPPEDREAALRADAQRIATAIGAAPHVDGLDELMDVTMDRRQALPAKTQQYLDGIYAARRNALAG